MQTESIIALVGVVAAIFGIVFGYLGYQRGLKKDSAQNGALMSDIGYIKAGIDDLKRKQETYETRHFALVERVTKVEESTKQAHKRIDRLEGEKE
jgi:hypothetical protein